jgi:hypothetical protein
MKRIFFLFSLFIFSSFLSISQEVVKWDFSYNPTTKMVELKAKIEEGWHLYSQFVDNDLGPVPTSFSFHSSNDFQLIDAVIEPKPIQKFDETFEATLDFFEHEVVFNQKIKVKKDSQLEGSVVYMVCNETMCLPPVDKTFKISIPKN